MEQELKNKILNTGTTILGIVCKDGVVMAGDRQVTAGNVVLQKNFQKVNQINDYLVISWTGGVSDALMNTKLIKAELKLKELKAKRRPTVREAANLIAMITYKSIRQPTMITSIVGTLLAGINQDGTAELFTIEPAGSTSKIEDFDANFGSGMPYVLGFLERQYKKDLTVEQGVELAVEALKSSTQRDIGSGYGIDVFTITKDKITHEIRQEISSEFKDKK